MNLTVWQQNDAAIALFGLKKVKGKAIVGNLVYMRITAILMFKSFHCFD